MTQLAHYRRRHAQYKTDPDLQALHAAAPFIVTWDDHESANDAWKGGAENHTEGAEGAWSERFAAAHQAYAEWMPVRYEPGGQLYRRLDFGSLASLSMLDLRSYRDQQAANGTDPSVSSPARTITGAAQMDWLLGNLKSTGPQWKLVGNPVMIAPVRVPSTLSTAELAGVQKLMGGTSISGVPYNVDQWDGYEADRNRVVRHLRDNAVKDTVFLTGDIHSGWACDIPADPASYPATGDSVAAELVCTSVTSDNLDDILNVPPRTGSVARGERHQGGQPAREVPRLRLARLLRPGRDARRSPDGLVRPRRTHRRRLRIHAVHIVQRSSRHRQSHAGTGRTPVSHSASSPRSRRRDAGSSCSSPLPEVPPSSFPRRKERRGPPRPRARTRATCSWWTAAGRTRSRQP